eukprot:CAMPEP_0176400868 /NCGR_PEP_ID=MMETSP0126-20121128/47965_1 /TAXON_ID=141414 ORGANISM="Strombidinopsis acuminatum, Strain SPMC142" /NCGR_SAMPLE_ID=MMETSP0126 /ASSEMBLY_ACC=CAM_ASM_000229 /LENGTH=61 /DNA_ID=CAMNT_0017777429 /DNA_START=483 /DNA_END=668 /DNA_ORIENTATION=+
MYMSQSAYDIVNKRDEEEMKETPRSSTGSILLGAGASIVKDAGGMMKSAFASIRESMMKES